jgi:hypothetical protein
MEFFPKPSRFWEKLFNLLHRFNTVPNGRRFQVSIQRTQDSPLAGRQFQISRVVYGQIIIMGQPEQPFGIGPAVFRIGIYPVDAAQAGSPACRGKNRVSLVPGEF